MILCKSNDVLVVGQCPDRHVRVLFADVTETALTQAGRHDCGPTAGMLLAQALLTAALAGAELDAVDETLRLQVDFDPAMGGVLAEVSGAGALRGVIRRRRFDDLDARADVDLDALMGELHASLQRLAADGTTLSRTTCTVSGGGLRALLAAISNASVDCAARVALFVGSHDTRIDRAVGVIVQDPPGSDAARRSRIANAFRYGAIADWLRDDTSLDGLRAILELPALQVVLVRPLIFGCRCSRERAAAVVRAALATSDWSGVRREGRRRHVGCELCGADYVFLPDDLG